MPSKARHKPPRGAMETRSQKHVKLPAHRAELPGNEISFLIVPLHPAYKAGLAGHLPAGYF